MKIQLTKRWQRYSPGDVITLADSRAQWLISRSPPIAKPFEPEADLVEAAAVAVPETATIATRKPKKRKRKR